MNHQPHPAIGQAAFDGAYIPSPVAAVRDQVALYEATNGAQGNTLEGRPVVILTTIGAHSGNVRKSPIIRILENGIYVAVASDQGAPSNPSWYGNLRANPEVRLQDGSTVYRLRAREVFAAEKDYWWHVAERFWPYFPAYRERAVGRDIPVVLLEPITN